MISLTPEQKKHAINLMDMGEKQKAVQYFKKTLNVTDEQALVLTEKLAEEATVMPLHQKINTLREDAHPRAGKDKRLAAPIIPLALGILMLAGAVYAVVYKYQFEQRAIVVKGMVIGYETYQDRDNGRTRTMYTPNYQYEFEGKTYTHLSRSSSSTQDFEINEEVDVFVNPQNPTEIIIDTFWEKWLLPILLGPMGIVLTWVGYKRITAPERD